MVDVSEALERFLLGIQEAFLSLDLDHLIRIHRFPLPVYTVAGVLIIRSEEEFAERTRLYRAMMEKVVRSTLEILECSETRNGRFTVTTRWTDLDKTDTRLTETVVRYFFFEPAPETWEVEMLEYVQEPLPIDAVDRIIH